MKFFTKFARKLSAIVLNAAFPSACCTHALVAAANAGCFSCTTTCQAVRRADTCSDSHNSARNSLALQTRLQVTSRLRLHHALRVPVVMNDQSPSSQERIPPHFGEQIGNFLRRPTPLPHAPADCQTSVQFLRLAHRMPNQHAAAVLERSPYGPRIRVRTTKHFASSLLQYCRRFAQRSTWLLLEEADAPLAMVGACPWIREYHFWRALSFDWFAVVITRVLCIQGFSSEALAQCQSAAAAELKLEELEDLHQVNSSGSARSERFAAV